MRTVVSKDKVLDTDKEHTVASARPPKAGRQVSFTIPNMPRISLRNIATRTKAFGLIAVLAVGLVGGFTGSWLQDGMRDDVLSVSVGNEKKVVTSKSQLVSSIAKNVGASVVSINVSASSASSGYGYYGFATPQQQQAAGTGIIISKDGLILTNRHVVPEGTTRVSVTLSDGTELNNVKVIGRTSEGDNLDIAILKITNKEGHTLPVATLGDSSKVSVGDDVVAIGNALGQFQNTVTTGIISGYGRSITAGSENGSSYENLENLFQTDAAINQGNSGGPLVNLNGQVIGINTAVASDSQNIGFAIPINDVKGVIAHVIETGKFERPYLGIRYIPLTADVANEYGLSTENGAYIAPAADPSSPSVLPDSAAAKAGLQEGDVITKVAGTAVDQKHSLTSLLGKFQPGDKVSLSVLREGKTLSVDVTLGTAPSSE